MLDSAEFRELLIADMALVRGVASARDVAAALQRFWEARDEGGVSMADELAHSARLPREALHAVEEEVGRLITDAGGDAQVALTRRGGLDRSIHLALGTQASNVSMALTEVGAGARAPLHTVDPERYTDFIVTGEGGMGVVYVALDTEMNRRVAFKMVRPSSDDGQQVVAPTSPIEVCPPRRDTPGSRAFAELKARFLQEAWVTGGLSHPGVVPVYEMGQTSTGVPYYTMKFVKGQRTLKDALDEVRDGPVEDRLQLLEPFLKLCDTVAYAHSKGVIHRDLKPENVALGEFGEVVLLDWGLAKLEGREDLAGSRWQDRVREFRDAGDMRTVGMLGTAGYMAPEAVLGRLEQVDAKSDVYGLGAMLYEILTGQLPHELSTYPEYIDSVTGRDPRAAADLIKNVPAALSDLAGRCLARERLTRPAEVSQVAREIRSWQAASALEREVEGHLRDATAALDAAGAARGNARLRQLDRAAATLSQVADKQPEHASLSALGERANALREAGIREREKASGRRLLVRGAIVVLALAAIAVVAVLGVVEGKRREADQARARAVEAQAEAERERDLKEEALEFEQRYRDLETVIELEDDAIPLLRRPQRYRDDAADWVETAELLVKGREQHAEALSDLEKLSVQEGAEWVFEDQDSSYRHQVLSSLIGRLDAIAGDDGLLQKMRALSEEAESPIGSRYPDLPVHPDLNVTCHTSGPKVLVGDPFVVSTTVTNTGTVALPNVTLAIRGRDGTRAVGNPEDLSVTIPSLEPGQSRELNATFTSDGVGERQVEALARDEGGRAAAGSSCGVMVEGLPALQVEMIDLSATREKEGVFEVGQEFLYSLTVLNDMGASTTPELKVVWDLPPELEFRSGAGDRGVEVTGSGQRAESSVFMLVPNEQQQFELLVRANAVPPRHLVKTKARIQTTGGVELATETETTTLRPRAGR